MNKEIVFILQDRLNELSKSSAEDKPELIRQCCTLASKSGSQNLKVYCCDLNSTYSLVYSDALRLAKAEAGYLLIIN